MIVHFLNVFSPACFYPCRVGRHLGTLMIESDSAAQSSSMVMKAGVGKNGNVDDRIESSSTLSSVKHPSTKLIFYFLLCFQSHSARELLIICPDPGFRLRVQGWCDGNIDDLIQHIRFCEPPLTWAHFYLLNMFLSFTLLLEALVFRIKNRGSTIRNQRSRIKTYMFNCWHKIHLLIGGCCVLWYPRCFGEKLHLAKTWML